MNNNLPTPEKLVGALSRGLAVLRYLVTAPNPVGVTHIARDLELNSSTCFNILKTLVHEGLVVFDENAKTYAISIGLVELAKGTLEKTSFVRMLRPQLENFANKHNVTVTLWMRSRGERVVMVDLAENPSAIRVHMSIGQRLPLYIAALGRCMAAYSDITEQELREHIDVLRWADAPSFEDYYNDVKVVRELGYAVDDGNYVKGVTSVSVPILDANNQAVMAISAVGFSAQLNKASVRALGENLSSWAVDVSRAFSGRVQA